MILYYFIFITLLIFIFLKKKEKQNNIFIIFLLGFYILSFMRWEVGTDWESYYNNYELNNSLLDFYSSVHFEKGYQTLNFISKKIYDNYNFLLFIQATIIFSFIYYSLKRTSSNLLVSLFYLYTSHFGNIFFVRQSIAVSIILFSIKYIEERKILKFYMIVFLAMSFHISALIFIPAYFIYRIKLSNSILYCSFFIILFIAIFLGKGIIFKIFEIVSPHRLIYLNDNQELLRSKNSVLLTAIVSRSFFIIYYMLVFWKKRIVDLRINGFINFYLFSCILYILCVTINPMIARVSLYYEIINLYLCASFFHIQKNKKWKIIFLIPSLLYLLIRFHTGITSYLELFVPYKSFL
ncbi:MAG: EpsG family protein [Fusobacteriaceae bacterium]